MSQPQRGAPKTALDHGKLALKGEKQEGSKGFPDLKLRFINNNPRITIYPNLESDSSPINIAMDTVMMDFIIDTLNMAIRSKEPCGWTLDIKDKPWDRQANRRSEHFQVTGKIGIGRDENGVVFMKVGAYKRPSLKFNFKSPYLLDIKTKSGEAVSPSIESEIAATGWVRRITSMYYVVAATNFTENQGNGQQRNNNGGGYGGGNNNGGGYGGGNNNGGGNGGGGYGNNNQSKPSSSGWDNDIPF